MARNHHFPWREAFLAALRQYPVLRHGCDVVGIHRSTVANARRDDPEFDQAVADALEDGIDRAEAEAFRRGVVGFHEPVIHQGRLAYVYERKVNEEGKEFYEPLLDANGQPVPLTVTKHSDALLALVLKGRREAYSTNRTELTGAGGSPLADDTSRATRVAALLKIAEARKALDDLV